MCAILKSRKKASCQLLTSKNFFRSFFSPTCGVVVVVDVVDVAAAASLARLLNLFKRNNFRRWEKIAKSLSGKSIQQV